MLTFGDWTIEWRRKNGFTSPGYLHGATYTDLRARAIARGADQIRLDTIDYFYHCYLSDTGQRSYADGELAHEWSGLLRRGRAQRIARGLPVDDDVSLQLYGGIR
jgi:hypothetical protein